MNHEGAESPLRHPIHAAHDEAAHLADVAKRGESSTTPAVIIGGVGLVLLPLVATIITLAFAVGYFATRGSEASAQAVAHTASPAPRSSSRFDHPTERPIDAEALMETFWTIVTYAVLSGLFVLPFALLALLWRAAEQQRTA